VKLFLAYATTDASDFATYIYNYFHNSEHIIFADIHNAVVGEQSNMSIEKISESDIFIVIITDGSLKNLVVEKEVFQAQTENKTIIPCIYRNVKSKQIKWGLDRIQGIEFENKFELARNLEYMIVQYNAIRINKSVQSIDITSHYSPKWYLKRAYKFKEIGKYKESDEMFDELLKLQPENIDAWREKGFCLIKIGKYEEALEAYEKALQIDPNNVDALNGKGDSLIRLERYEEALEAYEKALQIDPNNVYALKGMRNTFHKLKLPGR
jgi:tetratricopeptide (TPR) repeat protein